MKTINETFTDEDFKKFLKQKGKVSWTKYLILLREYADKGIKKGELVIK